MITYPPSNPTSVSVTQSSHGFVVGDIIRLNGASTYAKAQADSASNAEVVGIVSVLIDTNNFTIATSGRVTGLSGLTADTVYFLSPSSAGALTATEPTTIGQISKPILVSDSTTSGFLTNYQGEVLVDLMASPTFTGTPLAPTAAVDTNTMQLATTAFVLAQAASATPLADATTAVVGTSTRFARSDHVHPMPPGTLAITPGGRLTANSPYDIGDQTSSSTVINYVPDKHNVIVLWDGSAYVVVNFSTVNLSFGSANIIGVPMDVFGYLSSGTLALSTTWFKNATVTMTIASPCVVTWNSHGMSNGDSVVLKTTGALPTGLANNTTYFVTSVATNTFRLVATQTGAVINTTGSQSGTHTAYQCQYRSADLSQYDGRMCANGDKTKLHLGMLLPDGVNTVSDTVTWRGICNRYNKRTKPMLLTPGYADDNAVTSYSFSSTTWALIKSGTGDTGTYLSDWEQPVSFRLHALADPASTAIVSLGIGDDSCVTAYCQTNSFTVGAGTSVRTSGTVGMSQNKGLGRHIVTMLGIVTAGTATIYADIVRSGGATDVRGTYLVGEVWG